MKTKATTTHANAKSELETASKDYPGVAIDQALNDKVTNTEVKDYTKILECNPQTTIEGVN